MKLTALKQSLKIAVPYLLLGGLYIVFSDKFVRTISFNDDMVTQLQTYKGWGFIFLTTLLLFSLLYRYFNKLETEKNNLELSEKKWRSLVNNSPDFITLLDKEGRFLFMNRYANGFNPEKVIGTNSIDYLEDSFKERYKYIFKKCIETNSTQRFEFKAYGDNKSYRYYEEYLVPIINTNDEIILLAIARDITDRKNFELSLKESEEKYRTLFENMSEGFAYCKMIFNDGKPVDFIYLTVNPQFSNLTGLKKAEGKKVSELIPGIQQDNPDLFDIYGRVSLGGKPETFETYVPGLNDWFSVSVYSPHHEHFVAVFTIVTERKQTELALQKNRRFLADIIEHSGALIYVKDLDGRYELVNKKWEDVTSINRNKALGKTDQVLFPGIDGLQYRNNDLVVIKEGKLIETEEALTTNHGKKHFISIKFPTLDENGDVNGICGMSTEVTERIKTEQSLRESEERFRSTLDNMLEGCQILDSELKYLYINNAAETHNHISKNEMHGKKYTDVWPGIENTYVFSVIKKCLESKESLKFENEFTYPDGNVGWFDLSIQPVPEGVFILSVDITERKKVELEIYNSREQLRALTANLENVREEERIHLSRELHDHLGQNLTGLKMDVAYLAKHIKSSNHSDENNLLAKTDGMEILIDELIHDVRKISSELRPNVLDYLGLVPAIEWQVEEFKKRTEIECEYNSNTSKIDFGMQVNSSIFRIIQEAFTNVIRHAKASKVILSIDEQKDFITIKMLDNGVGIKSEDISNLSSLGILGMKERTLNFNGSLKIEKSQNGGTLLTLVIPKEVKND